MFRIEARIVVEAGELQCVELELGRIVDQLHVLPAERADGVGIEAQADALSRPGVCSGRGGSTAERLNEGTSVHSLGCITWDRRSVLVVCLRPILVFSVCLRTPAPLTPAPTGFALLPSAARLSLEAHDMETRNFLAAFILVGAVAAAGIAYAGSLTRADQQFVDMAAKADMTEAHEGQLAQDQATQAM